MEFNSLKKNRTFIVKEEDKALVKFMMIYEGECQIGVKESIKKYNYSEQQYYKILKNYNHKGLEGLYNKKPGVQENTKRDKELVNQIVRMRYLDPFQSASVIAQKINQLGYKTSTRSVERVITEFGLQKKLMSLTQKLKKVNKTLK
jgi:hypothetical protein